MKKLFEHLSVTYTKMYCQKHEVFYESVEIFKGHRSPCPKCADELTKKAVDETKRRYALEAKEKAKKSLEDRLSQSLIPARFLSKSFADFVPVNNESAAILNYCKKYADRFSEVRASGKCLVFYGERGTGKTHLAAAIARQVLSMGYVPLFMTVSKAVRSIKATYAKNHGVTETEALRDLIAPDLLILDEVGVQFGSDAEKLILFDVINARYEEMKPTIFVSNCTLAELETFLGERITDRILENGGKRILFNWESQRARVGNDL